MSDFRETLLNQIMNSLYASDIPSEYHDEIRTIVVVNLENYELSERSTEVAIRDNSSEQLLKLYIGSILAEGLRKKTANLYYRTLKRFYHDTGKQLTDVNSYDIRLWLASLKQSGICQNTVVSYYDQISAFYTWLQNEGIMSDNPCKKIKKIRKEDKLKYPFSETELDRLRLTCKTVRERAIVELLLSSGIRVGELCNLNVDDIDFIKNEVKVIDGKGGKNRLTYMNDIASEYLKIYLFTRKDNDICLFRSRNNNRISTSAVQRLIRKLGEEAKVTNCHPHRFRRTFATNCIKKKMDISTLQILMGHNDVNTTMQYVTLNNDYVKIQYQQCS